MSHSQPIAINLQQNQQILSIPNNVQVITSSSSNNMNTHTNSTNIVAQTSSMQRITNQTNLVSVHSQPSQASGQIQLTMQPNIQMQMVPTTANASSDAQMPVIPQLTGSLTLSLSEDGRFLLKHNANAPQDAQSQMILQAILSGALCNVTLINEPAIAPITSQSNNVNDSSKTSIIVKANDSVTTSNVIHSKVSGAIVSNATAKQCVVSFADVPCFQFSIIFFSLFHSN